MAVRIPRVLLVLATGLTLGLVGVATLCRSPRPGAAAEASPAHVRVDRGRADQARVDQDGPLAVLHDWDLRRAEAWATGDAHALAQLYTGRSRAGAADLALLRRYTARGLVVRGLRMQVLRARVLIARPGLLEIEVTDRLAAAMAVRAGDPGSARRLPAGTASTRVLSLHRVGERWLMARVDEATALG